MTGKLDEVLSSLITTALPDLIGDGPDDVKLTVSIVRFEVNPESADALAGEPRAEDRTELFTFDSSKPEGPYTLSQSPYPGPRRIYLTTNTGDRVVMLKNEIFWDETDPRRFTLQPRPNRDLDQINGVLIVYGVTSIFTKIKAAQSIRLQLSSTDSARLKQAEALVISVIELNRRKLIDESSAVFIGGEYSSEFETKTLVLIDGESPDANSRTMTLRAEIELKASRTLRDDEGKPITRIRTPGRALAEGRPVDIQIDVEG